MSGRDYTTDGLVDNIARRGAFPMNESTYTPEEMILVADDRLQDLVVPVVMSLKADFFKTFFDYTTTDATAYTIPIAAINRTLINVTFVDSAGRETPLTPVDYDREISEGGAAIFPNGAYFVRGDQIVLYPRSTSGKTLRLHYYRLPNKLVPTTEAAHVLSIDSDTGVVTCSSVPSSWQIGDAVCCVAGTPGFALRFESQDLIDSSSPTIILDDVSDIAVGDWIALEGESPIPQIPGEAHPMLAQATLVKLLEGLGDPKMNISKIELADVIAAYKNIGAPRVEKAPPVLVSSRRLWSYIR